MRIARIGGYACVAVSIVGMIADVALGSPVMNTSPYASPWLALCGIGCVLASPITRTRHARSPEER